jgi:hypothetical protein
MKYKKTGNNTNSAWLCQGGGKNRFSRAKNKKAFRISAASCTA